LGLESKFRAQSFLDDAIVYRQGFGVVEISGIDLNRSRDSSFGNPAPQYLGEALVALADGESRALVAHDADEAVQLTHLGRLSV
jgi:hypothetical protein